MDEPLWQPSPAQIEASQVERFRHHVNRRLSLDLSNYEELYAWSCDRYDQFWGEVWHFCGVVASKQFETVVDMSKRMDEFPAWFPEARLNWAENMLQERSPDKTALIQCSAFCRILTKVELTPAQSSRKRRARHQSTIV